MRPPPPVLTNVAVGLTILLTGCEFSHRSSPTAPSETLRQFVGAWRSAPAAAAPGVLPAPESCTDIEWEVTELRGTTVTGRFRARCAGGVEVAGTGSGTPDGDLLRWNASGAATAPGLPNCSFSLSGTARREGDGLRVDYSGQTCLGPVSGSELLHRR